MSLLNSEVGLLLPHSGLLTEYSPFPGFNMVSNQSQFPVDSMLGKPLGSIFSFPFLQAYFKMSPLTWG